MENKSSWSSCTFELEDIEIIDHKTGNEEKMDSWNCNKCNLFYLNKGLLEEHMEKKHSIPEIVKCKYCNKAIFSSSENRECFANRKCETCEYKCSSCPQRFLRRSSLVNHEKKHFSPKKKRMRMKQKNNAEAENICVLKGLKRKISEVHCPKDKYNETKPKKSLNIKRTPKKKENSQAKTQTITVEKSPAKRLCSKTKVHAEDNSFGTCSDQLPKHSTVKSSNNLEVKESDKKSKQTNLVSNHNSQVLTPNIGSSENSVNYKPFSCHVCGNTFASDSALLDHIKTHGENAAKSFKCKFCGDEFDDIYKMQYHLAICPLAEDELESSLKHVIPLKITKKSIPSTTTPRKRGRPKKTPDTVKHENINSTIGLANKRESLRKRKYEVVETNISEDIPCDLPSPSKIKKSQKKILLNKSDGIIVTEEKHSVLCDDNDKTGVSKGSEADNEKKKLHQCPFPRCDFKFTREKALLCHMRNHSDDFDDSLKCHKCDIPFDDIHTLRLHINTCKGIKEERDEDFNRSSCQESSPNRLFQKTNKDFVCHQCGRSFQNQEKLNRHQESCGSKFVCRICKDDFLNQHSLDEHFGSKHPPFTAYHCYSCDEDFISELFFKIHQTDEHERKVGKNVVKQNVTNPLKDMVRELVSNSSPKSVENIKKKSKATCVKPQAKISGSVNISKTLSDKIDCSQVTIISTGKFTKKTHSLTRRCQNSIGPKSIGPKRDPSPFYWCPICVVGFDVRSKLRFHLREKHVGTNSIYPCQICEVQMPVAEMMIYHLELHGSNMLSINRFSKLVTYAKQKRMSEIDSLEMEIKSEKDCEDKIPPTQKCIDVVGTDEENKEICTDKIIAQNKVAANKRGLKKKVRNTSIHSVVINQKDASTKLGSLAENKLIQGSKRGKKITPKTNKPNKKEKCGVPVDGLNGKTVHKHRNKNYMNFERSGTPPCLRRKYSSINKANKSLAIKNSKGKNTSNRKVFEGNQSISNTEENGCSEALKTEDIAKKSVVTPKNSRSRVRQRRCRSGKQKQNKTVHPQNKTLHVKACKNVSPFQSDTNDLSENLTTPGIQLDDTNDSSEDDDKTMNISRDKISTSSGKKPLLPENEQLLNLMSNKNIAYAGKKIETDEGNIEENNLTTTKECLIKACPDKVNREETINLSSFPVESHNANAHVNSECNNKSIHLISQLPEAKEMRVTKGSNKLKSSSDLHSEIFIGSPINKITNEHLKEVEQEKKVQVLEESTLSKSPTAVDSDGICCTMCSESFYNQDELLDHLTTHI